MVPAGEGDLPSTLQLFDEAIIRVNRRGVVGQWGTAPLPPPPDTWAVHGMDQPGTAFAARLGDRVVGIELRGSHDIAGEEIDRWILETYTVFTRSHLHVILLCSAVVDRHPDNSPAKSDRSALLRVRACA